MSEEPPDFRARLAQLIEEQRLEAMRSRRQSLRELAFLLASASVFSAVALWMPKDNPGRLLMIVIVMLQWCIALVQIAAIRTLDERLALILDSADVNRISFTRHLLYRLAGLDPMPLYRKDQP